MAKLWLLAMVGALVAEYVAMYVFPKHYAKLAFIPFLSREEPLMRRLVAAAYRDATPSALTVGELGLEGLRHDDEEAVGAWQDGRGWLRMKYKFFGWNRTMGVVAILPRIAGDTLRLETRMFPAFCLSLLPMMFLNPNPRWLAMLLLALLVATGVAVFMLRQRARASLSVFLDSIETRAHRTLSQRPR
ncbi:MAG: hypothetical protein IPL19_12115 [Sandaracinaceae bacterium]|nr:hypothetical protein [Sandaracinaceae bacterium]MBK7778171.1 hypothetical protein [Sandaracinaceae bacterium]MBK8408715.1 hypothetical protein [Sandaracinaceae bacterium]MBK8592107.1 hypothetical protein [Sandaracinaceae bacterium]